MKTYRLLLSAAVLAAVACSKESEVIMPGETYVGFEFNAVAEGRGNGADSKTTISQNEGGKLQTYWVNEDAITVYSSADTDKGYTFTTSLTYKATTAGFAYEGEFTTGENYMAIYPAGERIFSFENNTISGVEVPAQQQLVAGDFDKDAAVATACSAGETTLSFKNATALVKFQVADERVVSGSVAVTDGENIAGTFTAALDSEKAMAPVLTASEGTSSVEFKIDGTTKLLPGTDYYVSVAPATLAKGFDITLANAGGSYIKKTYDIEALERNKIYNVGDVTSNKYVSKIELNFNFSDSDAMDFTGWDIRSGRQTDIVDGEFILNGQKFVFKSAKKSESTTEITTPSLGASADPEGCLHMTQKSCLGLPMVEDYRLASITIITDDTNNSQPLYIESERQDAPSEDTAIKCDSVKGPKYKVELEGTLMDTVYWLYQGGSGTQAFDMSSMTLTYEKVSE